MDPNTRTPASRLGTNPRLAWTAISPATVDGPLIVCEGIPDALTAAQHGITAVAVLGAQTPDARMAESLARHSREHGNDIVAVIDADDAGRQWGQRLTTLLADRNIVLQVVEPPDGLDLNTWALTDPIWTTTLNIAHRPELTTTTADGLEPVGMSLP